MVKVSAIFYEFTADEVKQLPFGFLLLEMNAEHGSFRVFEVGKDTVKRERQISYISVKEPPAEFEGGEVRTRNGGKPLREV